MTVRSAAALLTASQNLETPAFLLDESILRSSLMNIAGLAREAKCRLLYSMKPLSLMESLRWIAAEVDGLAAASVFEARLAGEILGGDGSVHLMAPGLRPDDLGEVAGLCDFVSLNSLSQWRVMAHEAGPQCSLGLRINPRLSRVPDARYDPCRADSKLGVPIEALAAAHAEGALRGLEGLHFHTACDSRDFSLLLETVERLESMLPAVLEQIRWINLGGGYLFDQPVHLQRFFEAVAILRESYGLEVYCEPGAAFVRAAGSLVATVIDLLPGDSAPIAVLDTTINHMPEVFEYQFSPPVAAAISEGGHRYLLVGSSCLAGDLFGTYAFPEPLQLGSKVIFIDAGAYSLVKASMFNGINLPTIYALRDSGEIALLRRFGYGDFLRLNGGESHATL